LQTILNSLSGSIGSQNVITGQTGVGLWSEDGTTVTPTLQFTFTGGNDTIGIFDGGTPADQAVLYANIPGCVVPACQPSETVTIKWLTANSGTITPLGSASVAFSGISSSDFGFYLSQGGNTYYSASNLNSSSPTSGATFNLPNEPIVGESSTQTRVLSYQSTLGNDLWAVAFEDGTDFDYNDQVLTVESITPAVPEPAAVVLLGTVAFLCASALRRKLA
jgi:hypothetical protein